MKVYLVMHNYFGYKYEGQHDIEAIYLSKESAEKKAVELRKDPEVKAWVTEYDVEDAE